MIFQTRTLPKRERQHATALPNPASSGARGYGSSWPDYVHEAKHAYGYEKARMKVVPTPREIQRMEDALEWLMLIGGETEQAAIDNRRIVWMRADGYRWRQICIQIGCVRSTAWRRWTAALVTISNRLNKHHKTRPRHGTAKSAGDKQAANPRGTGAKRPP